MKRKIKACFAVAQRVDTGNITGDLKSWLEAQAVSCALRWLLAHADDGVTWGRFEDGTLLTSDCIDPEISKISPPLCVETLQQVRLFGPEGELLLWRDGDRQWHARLIRDVKLSKEADWQEAVDESYILWGTNTKLKGKGFTLMSDGAQGLRHAVPLEVHGTYDEQSRPLRLKVRHYVKEDVRDGYTRIVASRLVKLETEGS